MQPLLTRLRLFQHSYLLPSVRESHNQLDIKLLPSGLKRGLLLLPAWTRRPTPPDFDESWLEAHKLSELSLEGRTLFDFLCLIVDIKYKRKYGKTLEWKGGRGTNMDTLSNNGEGQ